MKTDTPEFRKVRIREGVFRDFTGMVQGVSEERRMLRVLVTLFGRSIVVELPVEHVREIS